MMKTDSRTRAWALGVRVLLVAAASSALALLACSPIAPVRTRLAGSAICNPQNLGVDPQKDDSFASVPAECANLVEEVAPGAVATDRPYSLHFVEYDDQGQLYPATKANGEAPRQADLFLDELRARAKEARENAPSRVSVVVFVHGWKHDADSADSNVRWFRAMLHKLADVESRSSCPRQVIGLYAGWRGDSTEVALDLAKDTTFWTRKKAATRVAEGQIRELLSRIRAIQDINNAKWNGKVEQSRQNPEQNKPDDDDMGCSKAMRLTIVGHSFGGLVVYNALNQSLIRDISDLHERIIDAGRQPIDPVIAREGDLIVTINPAVEAAPFVALALAARAAGPNSYHSPVFVSITSANDLATRLAFPAARFFNTILNRYPAGNRSEHTSAVETLGQDQDYVDYTLNTVSELNKEPGHAPIGADPVCEDLRGQRDFSVRYKAEIDRLRAFEGAIKRVPDANAEQNRALFPRQFCINVTHDAKPGGDVAMALRPRKGVNLNSPVWNVYTAKPILNDHSDLLNLILIDFLRQLYEEGASTGLGRQADAPAAAE